MATQPESRRYPNPNEVGHDSIQVSHDFDHVGQGLIQVGTEFDQVGHELIQVGPKFNRVGPDLISVGSEFYRVGQDFQSRHPSSIQIPRFPQTIFPSNPKSVNEFYFSCSFYSIITLLMN